MKVVILFFFSGYAGTGTLENNDEGIICLVDVSEAGGILDRLLPQLFDRVDGFAETTSYVGLPLTCPLPPCSRSKISRVHTLLLNCPTKIFNWNNPIVVAPDTEKDTPDGGA